jgi:hypothetical protein
VSCGCDTCDAVLCRNRREAVKSSNIRNNNFLSSVLTMLEATSYRLTPGCHDGNHSLFDTYNAYLQIFVLLNHLYVTMCK